MNKSPIKELKSCLKNGSTELQTDNTVVCKHSELQINQLDSQSLSVHTVEVEKSFIGLNGSIRLIEGENFSHFIQRYPYKKTKNNTLLSNSANKLKYLENKNYGNFVRNIFYCFRNIKALKILDMKYESEILDLIENPQIKKCISIIIKIYNSKIIYQNAPDDDKGTQFVIALKEVNCNRQSYDNTIKALDYCLIPLKNIYFYLWKQNIDYKNKNPQIEIIPENIIHEINLNEEKIKVSDMEADKFNKILFKSIIEKDRSIKRRDKKYKDKFN